MLKLTRKVSRLQGITTIPSNVCLFELSLMFKSYIRVQMIFGISYLEKFPHREGRAIQNFWSPKQCRGGLRISDPQQKHRRGFRISDRPSIQERFRISDLPHREQDSESLNPQEHNPERNQNFWSKATTDCSIIIERFSMTFTANGKRQKWNFCRLSSALCTVESKYLNLLWIVRDYFLFLCDLFKDYKERIENQR